MSTNEWNEVDVYDSETSEYYCAFLDILGYKEKADRFFEGKYNLQGRFSRAMGSSLQIFKSTSSLIDIRDLEVRFFSDSIIILLPENKKNEDNIFGLILFCSLLSAHLSFEDLLVRGGIAKGKHKESTDPIGFSFIASLALQKAYLLESKKATYPRIIIDRDLVNTLIINSHETKMYLVQEGDEYFVHFARQIINDTGNNEEIILKEMSDLQGAMNSQLSESVRSKYSWILDYYHWVLSNTPNIDISKFSSFPSGVDRGFKYLVI